jgi:hypothetical protein
MKTIKVQWIIRQAFGLVCGSLLACGLVVAQQPAPTEQTPEQLLSAEQLNRYCQLVVVGVMAGRFVADLRSHQAHVTSCQTRKERDRKSRWLTDLSSQLGSFVGVLTARSSP